MMVDRSTSNVPNFQDCSSSTDWFAFSQRCSIAPSSMAGYPLFWKYSFLTYQPLPINRMDAFAPTPPDWTQLATHASTFACPSCKTSPVEAHQVWINRRSPVFTEERRRKWQEFYHCQCGTAWWAWSSDRPPTDLKQTEVSDEQ